MRQILLMTNLALAAMICPFPMHCQPVVESWVQRYNGPTESDDQPQRTLVDSSGNVIVAGNTDAGITGSDWLIIKYSGAGVPLWTNRYNGPGNNDDYVFAIAVDGSGNVFATGSSLGSGSSYDYATIAYSSTGVTFWTNRYNGPANRDDQANAVTVDGSGNVFVTGYSYDSNGYSDYATIAYSAAGVALWTNRYNGPGNRTDQAQSVMVDGSGNVFVTGSSASTNFRSDYATIAYSSAGVSLWTNLYNGPGNNNDNPCAMAVDGSGNVFVAGSSIGSGNTYDYATVAYSGTGVPLWTNRYNKGGDDFASAVAVDGGGNVFVTGASIGGGSLDYATIAYSGAGIALWTNRYNGQGSGDDAAFAVALDGSSNVVVTGFSAGASGYPYNHNFATIAYSSAGVALWTNRYNGPGNSTDEATAVAVDGNGNVFVTGSSIVSGSSHDYATIAYSSTGVALWTNRYNGLMNNDDIANAVAVNGGGNVFVTGASIGGGTSYDYATVAYSAAGVAQWTNRYNGPGNGHDQATAVAVDGGGNVFVTGYSAGSGSGDDYATIKYSGAGVALWTNRYNGPENGDDQATAAAVDGNGNVFVTGRSTSPFGAPDYVTIKYSGAGVALWTNRYDGPETGNDQATGVAVDGSSDVFVTGYSLGGGGNYDYATIKYSAAGVPLWTNRYSGPGDDDFAIAVAVDGDGNVLVAGTSTGSIEHYDYATIKYSSPGVALWTNRYDGPASGYDNATALAVDVSGNVFVVGYSPSTNTFGNEDYVTIAYSGAGVALWTNRYNGPGDGGDYAGAVAVDSSGNVFITGYSYDGHAYDYATIAYSGAGVPLWTNRYSGPAGDDLPQTKQSLALGPDGSVYVSGRSDGDYAGRTANDFTTVKYEVAPTLKIARTPTNSVAVFWRSVWANYALQANTNIIETTNWSDVITIPSDDGTNKTVIVNPPVGNTFYRLKSP